MTTDRRFARRVFTAAAVYGILVLTPQYFMEARIGRDYPPAITHPEQFEPSMMDGCRARMAATFEIAYVLKHH